MIDNKKIEEAANEYSQDNCGYSYDIEKYLAFENGAKWMQEEFLKDLWHPASEKPRQKAMLLIEVSLPKFTKKLYYVDTFIIGEDWEIKCSVIYISRWLYIENLFSKKGDNIE